MSIGGRLVDTRGPRFPVMVGAAIMFVAMLGFAQLSLTTPMGLIAVLMSFQGLGFGMVMAPALVAGLADLPPSLTSQGAAMRSLLGQCAGAIAVATLGAVIAAAAGASPSPEQAQRAYNIAFAVAAGCTVVAFVLARRLPNHVEVSDDLAEAEAELLLAVE